jgi:S-sulfosulfanyl-L-cysteine sulfohydrolase
MKFTVIQMNDTHAYLDLHQEMFWGSSEIMYRPSGGYARIATLAKEIREENREKVLFCDCGDTFHGTYPAIATEGHALIPVLNALNIDAMTAHWEFAYGPKKFGELLSKLDYPMLASNVHDKETGKLVYPPYIVKEVGGIRLGIIGVASNIVDKVMPPSYSEGLYFTLGVEELPPIIDTLRKEEKTELIILVSHLGFPQDMKLLSEVKGVDICLSGHTHNRLYKPVLQGKTILIQSGCHGSFIGRLDIEVEGARIVNYEHRLIEVEAGIKPDPEVDELVKHALEPYMDELSEVVGDAATALNRGMIFESTMDNFLLQSLLSQTDAQVAFSNGWRYGAPIPPGNITLNDLYNMVPMNPPISTVELTGEEILLMIEDNLERTFSSDPYQQMGGYVKRCLGLKAYIKLENSRGHRIQKLFIGSEEVQANRYYNAAFITDQAVPEKYGRNRKNQSDRIIDAMLTYTAKHRPLKEEHKDTFVSV